MYTIFVKGEGMTDFGQKLSSLRKTCGMTQKELASVLHVSDKVVSKWENGQSEPDLSTIKEIAKCFSISLNKLLDEPELEKKNWNTRLYNFFKRNYMIIIQMVISYCALLTFEIGIGYVLGFNLVMRYVPLWATILLICFSFFICVLQSITAFFERGKTTIIVLKSCLLAMYTAMLIASFVLLSRVGHGSFKDLTIVTGIGFSLLFVAGFLSLLVDVSVIRTKAPIKLGRLAFVILIAMLGTQIGFTIGDLVVTCVAVEEQVSAEDYKAKTPTRIEFKDQNDLTIYNIGESVKLEINYYPIGSRHDPVTYYSSNEGVATVDYAGNLTVRDYGTTTISAYVGNSIGIRKSVTVLPVKISSVNTLPSILANIKSTVTIPVDLTNFNVNDRLDIYVTDAINGSPSYEEISEVQFFDDHISLDILPNSKYNKSNYTLYLYVNDRAGTRPVKTYVKIPVNDISEVNLQTISGKVGECFAPKYSVLPASLNEVPLKVTSSNSDVIEVLADGRIFFKSKGESTVQVTAPNGKTVQQLVRVTDTVPNSYFRLESLSTTGQKCYSTISINSSYDLRVWQQTNNIYKVDVSLLKCVIEEASEDGVYQIVKQGDKYILNTYATEKYITINCSVYIGEQKILTTSDNIWIRDLYKIEFVSSSYEARQPNNFRVGLKFTNTSVEQEDRLVTLTLPDDGKMLFESTGTNTATFTLAKGTSTLYINILSINVGQCDLVATLNDGHTATTKLQSLSGIKTLALKNLEDANITINKGERAEIHFVPHYFDDEYEYGDEKYWLYDSDNPVRSSVQVSHDATYGYLSYYVCEDVHNDPYILITTDGGIITEDKVVTVIVSVRGREEVNFVFQVTILKVDDIVE